MQAQQAVDARVTASGLRLVRVWRTAVRRAVCLTDIMQRMRILAPDALPTRAPQKREETMKRLLVGLAIAGLGCTGFFGCTKSVERAERDVQRAHDQAVRN